MAKLYWTKDIKKLIDKKIEHDSAALINTEMDDDGLFIYIRNLRIFKDYAYELIAEMEEADRKDDEYMASIQASMNARIKEKEEKPDDNG